MGKTYKDRHALQSTRFGGQALTESEFFKHETSAPRPVEFCAACGKQIERLRYLRSDSTDVFCSAKCFQSEGEMP